MNRPQTSLESFQAVARKAFLSELGMVRSTLIVGRSPEAPSPALRFIPETLLVPMCFHALAALVLGNFRFASFLK